MKKIKFKTYKNNTGLLIPFSFSKDIPFKPKRIFIIYGKKNSIRGDHAHLRCSQFLVPIFGSMTVYYENNIFNEMHIWQLMREVCVVAYIIRYKRNITTGAHTVYIIRY